VLRKKTFYGSVGNRVRLPAGMLQLRYGKKSTGRRLVHKIAEAGSLISQLPAKMFMGSAD
jgi:hypothetical protein